jgi:POT family proton-dependent oligopeptide transporter
MTYAEKVRCLSSLHYLHSRPFHQYVGFYLAFTLPTIVFLLCPIILLIGRNRYARSPPTGSVLASAMRLLRYASRGRWSLNPIKMIHNFNAPDFWESVKPSRLGDRRPRWMTFDDQWVDEVKRGFKACAVFCWYPIYCTFFVIVPGLELMLCI